MTDTGGKLEKNSMAIPHKQNPKPSPLKSPTKAKNQPKFRARRWQSLCSRRQSPYLLVGRGDCRSLSPDKALSAQQRFNQLERFQSFVASGLNQTVAAKRCGFGRTSAWRWLKRLEAGGLAALVPQTERRGRRSISDGVGLTPSLVKLLRAVCLGVGSAQTGFKLFAQLPQCPPPLARIVRRSKSLPQSLRKLISLNQSRAGIRECGGRMVIQVKGGSK